jgi:hypothetical protein
MPKPIDAVKKFLVKDEWDFAMLEDGNSLRTIFGGDNGDFMCVARGLEDRNQVVFYSVCPVRAPEDRRMAMAEFLTRANYGMLNGNFEMDFSDGEIRFKTGVDAEGAMLGSELIRQAVYTNVIAMDKYLPGIKSVLAENADPQTVLTHLENQ